MPIEATPQKPLLGAVSDILQSLQGAMARGQDSAVAGNQPEKYVLLDALMGALKPFAGVAEKASYGEPLFSGGKASIARGVDPDVAEAGSNFVPFGKIGAMVKALGGFGGMMAGLIPAGRRDLMMHHQTRLENLIKTDGSARYDDTPRTVVKEITSPSLGITKDDIPKSFAGYGSGVYMIPREGQFDPKVDPAIHIFNRDAYTARRHQFASSRNEGIAPHELAKVRLAEKQLTKNDTAFRVMTPQGTFRKEDGFGMDEANSSEMPLSRQVAMALSPNFRSLRQYENSPAGAETLARGQRIEPGNWGEDWEGHLQNYLDKRFPEDDASNLGDFSANDIVRHLRENAGNTMFPKGPGAQTAQQLLREAARAPSEYAEVKATGPVGLNADRWAGMLMDDSKVHPADSNAFIKEMNARGVPVMRLGREHGGTERFELADMLQQHARDYKSLANWPEESRALLAQPLVPLKPPLAPPTQPLASDAVIPGKKTILELGAAKWKELVESGADMTAPDNGAFFMHNGDWFKVGINGNIVKLDPGKNVSVGHITELGGAML